MLVSQVPPSMVILLHPLSFLRYYQDDSHWRSDALLCFVILYFQHDGSQIFEPAVVTRLRSDFADNLYTFALLSLCAICGAILAHRVKASRPNSADTSVDSPLPPLLIPSRTVHTRIFPQTHSFSYLYLYVGIPVGWKGSIGSILSADLDFRPDRSRGWFDVSAEDYLFTDHSLGLEDKLGSYLHSQHVKDEEWSWAYLVTAPAFLGFSFNPVSFWYIFDYQNRLSMMILEVNNTFDERRVYLLKSDGAGGVFTHTWAKDFHVSPFNSLKGSYSLVAKNPLVALSLQFDNVITLKSSKGHAKLIAKVSSEAIVNPLQLTSLSRAMFLVKWGWVGFLTSPRIVYQAGRLFFLKKLHVWLRPEVLNTSIARAATAEESVIEACFRVYLENLVSGCDSSVRLEYRPPSRMGSKVIWQSAVDDPEAPTLVFEVTTPAFYSRFVHYAHTLEALDRESAHLRSSTVSISDMSLMTLILQPRSSRFKSARNCNVSIMPSFGKGTLERIRWHLLKSLRCPPPEMSYPNNITLRPFGRAAARRVDDSHKVQDIRSFSLSPLDGHVRDGRIQAVAYRRALTRLFFAHRCAYGQIWAVELADQLFRCLLVLVSSWLVRADSKDYRLVISKWCLHGLVTGLVHYWSLLKG